MKKRPFCKRHTKHANLLLLSFNFHRVTSSPSLNENGNGDEGKEGGRGGIDGLFSNDDDVIFGHEFPVNR